MLRVAVAILAGLGALVAVAALIGVALPRAHTVSRSTTLARPAAAVFAVLQDVEQFPAWRSDVTSVEVLSPAPARRWREHGRDGTITFETTESRPPSRMVTRIADPSLPFGGSWTYVLAPSNGGTALTITEDGEVYNPLFRFMSRFVFGHTGTLDRFFADLHRRLDKPA